MVEESWGRIAGCEKSYFWFSDLTASSSDGFCIFIDTASRSFGRIVPWLPVRGSFTKGYDLGKLFMIGSRAYCTTWTDFSIGRDAAVMPKLIEQPGTLSDMLVTTTPCQDPNQSSFRTHRV